MSGIVPGDLPGPDNIVSDSVEKGAAMVTNTLNRFNPFTYMGKSGWLNWVVSLSLTLIIILMFVMGPIMDFVLTQTTDAKVIKDITNVNGVIGIMIPITALVMGAAMVISTGKDKTMEALKKSSTGGYINM
jgi:succinate-acetate transporter protein